MKVNESSMRYTRSISWYDGDYSRNSNTSAVCYRWNSPSGIGVGQSPQTQSSAEAKKKKNTQRLTTRGNYSEIAHRSCIWAFTVITCGSCCENLVLRPSWLRLRRVLRRWEWNQCEFTCMISLGRDKLQLNSTPVQPRGGRMFGSSHLQPLPDLLDAEPQPRLPFPRTGFGGGTDGQD